MYNDSKPEHAGLIFWCLICFFSNMSVYCASLGLSAMNMENLEGDYFVPGTELHTEPGLWKDIQAQLYVNKQL